MYRRVVSFLLVTGVLLSQAAVSGHEHGDDTPVGHDLKPHVHVRPPAGHDHGHRHHDHDQDDEVSDGDGRAAQSQDLLRTEHDGDAVYLGLRDIGVGRDSTSLKPITWVWFVVDWAGAGSAVSHSTAVKSLVHPPPPPDPSCPIYVRHLALLM